MKGVGVPFKYHQRVEARQPFHAQSAHSQVI